MNIQKSTGDMNGNGLGKFGLLLWVPLVNEVRHGASQFIEFGFVVNHLGAALARDGVIFPEVDRLLGADFLTHPAVDAANHVNLELLRKLFDLREFAFCGQFAGRDFDGAWWADEFAELTGHATLAVVFVFNESRSASVVLGEFCVPLFFGVLHRHFFATLNSVEEVFQGNE